MRSIVAACVLVVATVLGADDETVAQAFEPTHENLMEYAKESVKKASGGAPSKLKQETGLTDDELTELGEDFILEYLSLLDTEVFLTLIGDTMEYHVLGSAPEKTGTPSLESILMEERRLTAERVTGVLTKITKAHEGIDRRRVACAGVCVAAAVLSIVGGVAGLSSSIFSFWG